MALSWSQDSSPGHAAVIRDVLAHPHSLCCCYR
jgi:hypothetical protein